MAKIWCREGVYVSLLLPSRGEDIRGVKEEKGDDDDFSPLEEESVGLFFRYVVVYLVYCTTELYRVSLIC